MGKQKICRMSLQIAFKKPFSQRSETIFYIKKRPFRIRFFVAAGKFEKEMKYKTILPFRISDRCVDTTNQIYFPPENKSFLNAPNTNICRPPMTLQHQLIRDMLPAVRKKQIVRFVLSVTISSMNKVSRLERLGWTLT